VKVNGVGHNVSKDVGSRTNICEEIYGKEKKICIESQHNIRLGLEPDASKGRTHYVLQYFGA
jgi:hypothetical protein